MMKRVFLSQHAKAYDKDQDPDRPLTPVGEKDATQVAEHLKKYIDSFDAIYHSGKLRAQQTASIFGQAISPSTEVKEIEGLGPVDDPDVIAKHINSSDNPGLYVGHLPHMPKLVGLLVNGDEDKQPVNFNNGGIVSLIYIDNSWMIDWIITPSVVGTTDSPSEMFA